MRLYQRASDAGVVEAMLDLGRLYDNGNGNERPVRLDRTKALELFRMAADTGSSSGQYALAICLTGLKSEGLDNQEKDEAERKEAFRFMKLSAEQGKMAAHLLLARMYLTGVGVDRDLVEARRLCELAAARAPNLVEDWDEKVRELRATIAAEM